MLNIRHELREKEDKLIKELFLYKKCFLKY